MFHLISLLLFNHNITLLSFIDGVSIVNWGKFLSTYGIETKKKKKTYGPRGDSWATSKYILAHENIITLVSNLQTKLRGVLILIRRHLV